MAKMALTPGVFCCLCFYGELIKIMRGSRMKKLCLNYIIGIIFTYCVLFAMGNSSAYAADADIVLNHAALVPTYTGNAKCDNEVKYILSQLITDDMTTNQKVKICYDWIINNCSYGVSSKVYNGFILDFNQIEYLQAYDMLVEHVGVCDDYSAAFAVLTRAIGLNCRVAYGSTAKASGGMTGHAWCVIIVDGKEYVFDPQIDDNIARGSTIGYYRYCKLYEEVPEAYSFSGYNKAYPSIGNIDRDRYGEI